MARMSPEQASLEQVSPKHAALHQHALDSESYWRAGSDAWTPRLYQQGILKALCRAVQRSKQNWIRLIVCGGRRAPTLRERLVAAHLADAGPRSALHGRFGR